MMAYDDADLERVERRMRYRPFVAFLLLLAVFGGAFMGAYSLRHKSPRLIRFFASVWLPWGTPCERLDERCSGRTGEIGTAGPSAIVCVGYAWMLFSSFGEGGKRLTNDQCAPMLAVLERVDQEGLEALDQIVVEEGLQKGSTGSGSPGQVESEGGSVADEPTPVGFRGEGQWKKGYEGGRRLYLKAVLTNESESEVLESLSCKAELTVDFEGKPSQTFGRSGLYCGGLEIEPKGSRKLDAGDVLTLERKWLAVPMTSVRLSFEVAGGTPFGVRYAPTVFEAEIPMPTDDSKFVLGGDAGPATNE